MLPKDVTDINVLWVAKDTIVLMYARTALSGLRRCVVHIYPKYFESHK